MHALELLKSYEKHYPSLKSNDLNDHMKLLYSTVWSFKTCELLFVLRTMHKGGIKEKGIICIDVLEPVTV